jgi:hypothetical protein
MPAVRTSGGILVGLENSVVDLVSWQYLKYCEVAIVENQADQFIWRLVVVYGSPYEETKLEFIKDLQEVMGTCQGPTLVGGDFNLVRCDRTTLEMRSPPRQDRSGDYRRSKNTANTHTKNTKS